MQNFNLFKIEDSLKDSITRVKFKEPTPIQNQAIPTALEGKDILGTAQTGTGKTLAFSIPLINKLILDKNAFALVTCPTRELATQVMDAIKNLLSDKINIKTALLIGGESMQKQLRQLGKRARLIVGTPGRINDHLKRRSLNLSATKYLVLDETDRMLDMGFTPQIEMILKFVPKNHQTLLFSATLPKNILRISERYLTNPVRISVGSTTVPIAKIKQETLQVYKENKYDELMLKATKELMLMIDIGLGHYLTLGAIIFTIGVVGIFLNRKNIIVILMSIELILLAVNINLVSFSIFLNDLTGQIFALFILTVAAAEAAIGLAIIVVYYRNSGTIRVEEINKLKG